MAALSNKIDFVGFISVEHANPNGDPLNGNRPRDTVEGLGEISDVCIKRKLRNRLQDFGERVFGQVFAFKGDAVSIGVRGPVSLHPAFSIDPIEIESIQITKSVNSVTADSRSSDTMGMKHSVKFGIYKLKGSINCQLAEKTGFSDEDAEKIREALATLFENDSSAARPDGSMCMEKLFWFRHNCKSGQYYRFYYDESLEGLVPEVIV